MRKGTLIFFVICVGFMFSCKQNHKHSIPIEDANAEEIALYDECIEIHDVVMARMGEIEEQRTKLKEFKSTFPLGQSSPELAKINARLSALNKAENHMFDWMARFKDLEELERDRVPVYLESMKEDAQRMSAAFDESLSSAAQYLENN